MITIQYNGHSSLYIRNKYKILIDPYMKGPGIEGITEHNPNASLRKEQVDPDLILITHGHGDHFGQTIEIIKEKDPTIIASTKVCTFLRGKKDSVKCLAIEPGKSIKYKDIFIKAVRAKHRFNLEGIIGDILGTVNYKKYVPCGTNMGFILKIGDIKIYHSGDTKDVADVKSPDIAFLSMDGFRTMNYVEVLNGVKKINPKIVIPIHHKWNQYGKQIASQVKVGIVRKNLDSMFFPLLSGEILD